MFAPHEPNSKLSYFEKRASWEDVAAKGRAIVASDGVEVINDDAQEVEAWVMSGQLEGERNDLGGLIDITDGGPYDVILSKKSWQNKSNVGGWIQGWLCDCVWGSYHSGEPIGYGYSGRMCSHSYALMLYKNMRARKDFFGASVIDRENFIKDACAGKNVGSVEDKGNYQIVRDGEKVAIRIKRASADCYINGLLGFSIDTGDEVKVNILAWYPDDDGEMHIKAYADSGEFGGFYDVDGIHYVGDGYGYSIESALEAALWRCGVELDERIERIVDMIDDSLWGQLVAKRKRAFTQPKILDPSSNAYTALEEVCRVLSMRYPECEFAIENIYFDYGQDWRWTNIVCYKPDGHSFQVLNPREFEILVETYSIDYVVELIETDKYWPLRARGASVKTAYCDFEDGVYGDCTESGNQVKATVMVWDKYQDDDFGEYTVEVRYWDDDDGGQYYSGDGIGESLMDAYETACWQASFEPAQDIYEYCDFVENWLRGNVASVASRKTAKALTLDMMEYDGNHKYSYWGDLGYCSSVEVRNLLSADGETLWEWVATPKNLDEYPRTLYSDGVYSTPEGALNDFIRTYVTGYTASRKTADRYDQFFNGCYVADLKHWGNSIDDVEFEINAYAYDYTYKVDVWGTGLSNEGYGNSSWEVAEEYGDDIRAVAEKALDGLEFYHVTRDDVINQIVMLAPEIAEQPLGLDGQMRERIISDMVEYAIENEMDFNDQYQYYSRAYNTDIDDAKYYLNGLLDSYGFADVGDKDSVIESIIEDVAWDMIDGRYASNKNATRHFTYAEMQELDDEIEGRELHNATRLRYTTGTELA